MSKIGIEEVYEMEKYFYTLYRETEPDSNSLPYEQKILEFLCY